MEPQADGASRVRRAYAILGLRPGASLSEVRRRYRFLARRWHPDRYAADARNQAEAGAEMRRINDAYQTIVEERATIRTDGQPSPPTTRRMSPEEIDALAGAIGTDGPVDWFLGSIGWVGSAIEGVAGTLFAIWLAARVALGLWRRDFTVFREHPELVLLLVVLAVIAVRELWLRSRISRAPSQPLDGWPHGEE